MATNRILTIVTNVGEYEPVGYRTVEGQTLEVIVTNTFHKGSIRTVRLAGGE